MIIGIQNIYIMYLCAVFSDPKMYIKQQLFVPFFFVCLEQDLGIYLSDIYY